MTRSLPPSCDAHDVLRVFPLLVPCISPNTFSWLIVPNNKGPPGHTKKSRLITPPEAEFDIDAIDVKINKELKQLHDTIETFLKNPEPLTWIPPNDASSANSEFLKSLRIPAYANGKPSLLFHNLDICDHEEIEKIFKPPAPHMCVVMNCILQISHL